MWADDVAELEKELERLVRERLTSDSTIVRFDRLIEYLNELEARVATMTTEVPK